MESKHIPAQVKKELHALAGKEKARQLRGFFKTRKGEYAEGDKFLGVVVPAQRAIAKKYYNDITLGGITLLLKSGYHEIRMTALLMLVSKMEKTKDAKKREAIVGCFMKNIDAINNWDLVDLAAPNILGRHLSDKDKTLLYEFAASDDLWKQRIAILSTFYFIKHNHFDDTLAICEMLMDNAHDLIQKSIGWMLREIGKRDMDKEREFLDKYAATMPRISLRYALEHFNKKEKEYYMKMEEAPSYP